jgi:imidazolonepropionase
MNSKLIINIGRLVNCGAPFAPLRGADLSKINTIENAFLRIEAGRIIDFGSMKAIENATASSFEIIDANGAWILPSWCDSHTHLVFAASREEEFVDKLRGLSYADIAAKGGGILNSAKKLAVATEEELFDSAIARLTALIRLGTGAIEIKSGYGLSTESELKMLRVIKRIKSVSPIPVKSSFLGAHTFPVEYRDNHDGYIDLLINEMLPQIGEQQLADYVDVFCESGFFSVDEMVRIVKAAASFGLKPKLHVNQLNSIGGLQAAISLGAVSVDHLETMTETDIRDLASSDTIGTLLPTAAFFLRMNYQPARQLIDAGASIALASDFNPGSSPSGNMNFVLSLACIQMKMLPEEAINAATINAAFAMDLGKELGSIAAGKIANLVFFKPISSLAYLPYAFGENNIQRVMVNGVFFD